VSAFGRAMLIKKWVSFDEAPIFDRFDIVSFLVVLLLERVCIWMDGSDVCLVNRICRTLGALYTYLD